MEQQSKEVNILNWHAEDYKFRNFNIYAFGKDIEGNNYNIQVKNFKPQLYIRIRKKDVPDDKNNDFMKKLEKDPHELNQLIDTLNFIASKPLKCKKITDKEKDLPSDQSSVSSSSEDEEDEEEDEKICCFKHHPQDLFTIPLEMYNPNTASIVKELCKIEHKKDLYESFGNNDIIVLKLVFKSQFAFSRLKKALKPVINNFNGKSYKNKFITIEDVDLHLSDYIIDTYKSDLPPLLDFFHNRDIQPCGWITFNKYKLKDGTYHVDFRDIHKLDKLEFAPFKIMSWDIEADSSHGDFPLATKDYKKLAMDIADFYLNFIKKNKDTDKKTFKKIFKYILNIAFQLNNTTSTLDNNIKKIIEDEINIVYLKKNLMLILKVCLLIKTLLNKYLIYVIKINRNPCLMLIIFKWIEYS